MAEIRPFRALRYNPEKVGGLDGVVTQPYDKISEAMRARYLSLSPYNLVRVILGERFAGDSDTDNVYTRARQFMEDWIEIGRAHV